MSTHKKDKKPKTCRRYCFTINNPNESDAIDIKTCFDNGIAKYIVYQLECGKISKLLHFQGYIELKNSMTIISLRKHIKANFEICKGNAKQNYEYCTKKDETYVSGPYEYGTMSKQGNRTDWEEIRDEFKEGKTMKYMAEERPGHVVRYSKGLEKLQDLLIDYKEEMPEVIVIIGAAGAGKTRMGYDENIGKTIYNKPDCTLWFDGYEYQDVVIINEFNGQIPLTYMNNLLDRYPMQVQVKGGYRKFITKKIYITSNKEIDEWYPNNKDIGAFKRRITRIYRFDKNFDI